MRRSSARSRSSPQTLEDEEIAGAIKTDFIHSAEIMAITLAARSGKVASGPRRWCWRVVGIGITVDGSIAWSTLIVKADYARRGARRATSAPRSSAR